LFDSHGGEIALSHPQGSRGRKLITFAPCPKSLRLVQLRN
jgi:hypothetical protein